ncbi:MAG: PucR family transcriptional regulator ligand-binding domain-containing protein [Oscillospiraceae bacterium]|nr:PucR family transcriptional regulator ligand-binding domain-containing protein [Oscillospiraceae bacterium]
MAITLRAIIEHTQQKFSLKLLSGDAYLDHVVTWVHMAEDSSVAEFFWGNELVVTSGYSSRNEEALVQFISTLSEHRCAGIVLNTGKYIETVSPAVIDFCNQAQTPLFTMPWEMSITEFVQECCFLITKSNHDDLDLAKAVVSAINAPHESGRYRHILSEYFNLDDGFLLISISSDQIERDSILDQRRSLRIHTAMQSYSFPYLVFQNENRFFVLLNQTKLSVAREAAQRILDLSYSAISGLSLNIGIGDPCFGLEHLADCYQSCVSAVRCAALQNLPIVLFRDMGFYRLLYSVSNDALLEAYYRQTLSPLLEYDKARGGCYTETLFRYVFSGGSLQQVAMEMFTHRNTVSYRIGKIRELLKDPLETPADYLPYMIAYHAGLILRHISPLS